MASAKKPMWMFPHERERRTKLRQQIRKKQKELVKLKKELDAATDNPRPQRRSTALKTIGPAAAAPPLTLNLERSDFTDLLVPQLNSYTWAFYNCFRILQTQQTEYREIEELLLAIRDGLQREGGEEAKEKEKKKTKKKKKEKKPLLRVDQYYDEQLEPLAGLKDKVKRDHDAMRGLQKQAAGGAEELKTVKAGLKDLLEYVLKEYEDEAEAEGGGGGEEEEADAEDDEDDDDHTTDIVPPSGKAVASVPRPRVHWVSDLSFLRPERPPISPPSPPIKVFRAVEADDDEDDSSSSSDTWLE
ncbi:hypothetical protein SLS58_009830 [Diplodia intermedia]|uniref:Uncharacterized protein n=1 Tax=Diplodia intermedia TaxID=856260 RepID=A0ABR3TA32_9PEZI